MQVVIFLILSLVSFAALTFILIYLYYLYSFGYWKRRDVPEIKPSFPYGSTKIGMRDSTLGGVTADFYKELKRRDCMYGGVFAGPSPKLVILDLELIKNIFTRDFQSFTGRGIYINEKQEPIAAHLFNLSGQRWKTLRSKLTPTFTSGKMKSMFDTLVECSGNMKDALLSGQDHVLNIKDVCARFSTDVIGSCAFGVDCNSFKYPDAEFRVIGMKIFVPSPFLKVKKLIAQAAPNFAKLLGELKCPSIIIAVKYLLFQI